MSWEAQKHLYQVAFSHLDKFFQYKISSDFWQGEKKKKTFKGFSPYSPLSSKDIRSFFLGFLFFFNQASTVIAEVGKQAVDEFWIVGRGF